MKTAALAALVIGTSLLAANGANASPRVRPEFREAAIQQCRIDQKKDKPLSSQCRSLLRARPHHKAPHRKAM